MFEIGLLIRLIAGKSNIAVTFELAESKEPKCRLVLMANVKHFRADHSNPEVAVDSRYLHHDQSELLPFPALAFKRTRHGIRVFGNNR